jgi:hypothetical protein
VIGILFDIAIKQFGDLLEIVLSDLKAGDAVLSRNISGLALEDSHDIFFHFGILYGSLMAMASLMVLCATPRLRSSTEFGMKSPAWIGEW